MAPKSLRSVLLQLRHDRSAQICRAAMCAVGPRQLAQVHEVPVGEGKAKWVAWLTAPGSWRWSSRAEAVQDVRPGRAVLCWRWARGETPWQTRTPCSTRLCRTPQLRRQHHRKPVLSLTQALLLTAWVIVARIADLHQQQLAQVRAGPLEAR